MSITRVDHDVHVRLNHSLFNKYRCGFYRTNREHLYLMLRPYMVIGLVVFGKQEDLEL